MGSNSLDSGFVSYTQYLQSVSCVQPEHTGMVLVPSGWQTGVVPVQGGAHPCPGSENAHATAPSPLQGEPCQNGASGSRHTPEPQSPWRQTAPGQSLLVWQLLQSLPDGHFWQMGKAYGQSELLSH